MSVVSSLYGEALFFAPFGERAGEVLPRYFATIAYDVIDKEI